MKILKLMVKDLNRFLKYVERLGLRVSEGEHAVLTDDSEVGTWYVYGSEGKLVAEIIAHYVDTHYQVLMKLSSSPSDSEIIRVLIESKYMRFWRAPVEPVYIFLHDERLESQVASYVDDYECQEAAEAVQHYLSKSKEPNVLEKAVRSIERG